MPQTKKNSQYSVKESIRIRAEQMAGASGVKIKNG